MSEQNDNRRPYHKLSAADKAEIVRLYTTPLPDGTWMGVTAIAKRYGVRHNAIQQHLKRAGVETRTAKEAHGGGKRCKPITHLPVGEPPVCGCGCGSETAWNQRKNRWNRYVAGHYTQLREQSHSWRGGRSAEPYAPGWLGISRAIRERDGFRCTRCGTTDRRLHVHHIDTDKLNNAQENLITLCNACHPSVHAELRRKGGDA